MLEWFVVRTHYQQEHRAARELQQQRFKVFLPLMRTEHRDKTGLLRAKLAPLFKRYLFIQLHWHKHNPILSTRGVQSFVGFTEGMEKAPHVPKPVIHELKSRLEEVNGRDVVNFSRPKEIEPNMLVQILFGPYRNRTAPVQAVDGDAVDVLLKFAGVTKPVRLHRENLIAA